MSSGTVVFNIQMTEYPGGCVGECLEVPAVIVQGKDADQVETQALVALQGYFKMFPAELEVLKSKEVKKIEMQA